MADFTKTGAEIDAWAVVSAADQRVGADIDIPDDIGIVVEIHRCKVEAVAHDGEAYSIIEVSGETSGGEDWVEFFKMQTQAETAATSAVDAESAAAAKTVYLTSTTGLETLGDRYLIKDATPANSELVRNDGFANDDYITVVDNLTNTHADTADIYTTVEEFQVHIPPEYRRARVITVNNDADCDMMTRTRVAKITDCE